MTRGATWPASDFLTLVAKFRDERDWARFHSSKDLALSVSIEAAELLECFQWSGDDLEAPERSAEIEAEMADVLIYLAMLADHRGVDLDRAVRAKLAAAARKYPATAVKGEASAARAAARAIHEEARRTGANVPATAPSNTEEKKENASLPETVETCVAGDAKAAVRTSVPEEKTPAQDAQEVRKPDAPVVALKEEKTAVPIPPPPSEDPRDVLRRRAEALRDALARLEKHLETDPAGFWEASPDDRVAYVRYVEPVLAVWRLAGDWLGAPPKRRPPLDPHLYDWDDMTPGLAWAAFSELVGLERMETGAFLRAANSGLVGRLLRRILDASPEAWFGEGSSSRTPIA